MAEKKKRKKYDWDEIQAFYGDGSKVGWQEICDKFGCTMGTINNARRRGQFVSRSGNFKRKSIVEVEDLDWASAQKYYDENDVTVLDVAKFLKVGEEKVWEARDLHLFQPRPVADIWAHKRQLQGS